jgi:hypothetical protein
MLVYLFFSLPFFNKFANAMGYTRVSNFSLSYAYSVILNSDYRLHLGVAGSYQNLSYNQDEVNALTPDDPASFTRMNRTSNYNWTWVRR